MELPIDILNIKNRNKHFHTGLLHIQGSNLHLQIGLLRVRRSFADVNEGVQDGSGGGFEDAFAGEFECSRCGVRIGDGRLTIGAEGQGCVKIYICRTINGHLVPISPIKASELEICIDAFGVRNCWLTIGAEGQGGVESGDAYGINGGRLPHAAIEAGNSKINIRSVLISHGRLAIWPEGERGIFINRLSVGRQID